MKRQIAALLYAFSAVALGSTVDISKVNSSITVAPGQEAGDVSTVNGSIEVGDDARVRDVDTVNGSIRIGQRAQAQEVDTVNGGITVGEDAVIGAGVGTVNGKLELRRGASVAGRLETVNGALRLEAATVRGGLETVNGDIFVGSGSRVEGGIVVNKPSGWNWSRHEHLPRVTIEAGAEVAGALRFEREVELKVADGAMVGPIEGVTPRRVE
jgi:DUF4097 and DUF4098 domain-containing protein YvlB